MKNDKKLILIIDDVPPEANAMLQALYSRDPQSVTEHLKKVKESGPEKFMASYYVGYGHKSIGDCGTTTIYIEQVSMLAAKAVQDWLLYNGQEASTRYLDMSKQAVLNPLGSAEGKAIQEEWMAMYQKVLDELVPIIKAQFPRKDDQKESVYEKAVKAKAFDIARGFLPAGVTTLLSWHTNLRQAYDHIRELLHHPAEEIREIARTVYAELKAKYPNSFSHKEYPDQEAYMAKAVKALAYFDDPKIVRFEATSSLDMKALATYMEFLKERPVKTELPKFFRRFGNITSRFLLDFGSFRDLQRHRAGLVLMPLLSTRYGFTPWYLENLPDTVRQEIVRRIAAQEKRLLALKTDAVTAQYYIGMGYATPCETTMSLPAALYLAELRSGQTVHPTLRVIAQKMGASLKELIPDMAVHCDMSSDEWSIKRGSQDIVKK